MTKLIATAALACASAAVLLGQTGTTTPSKAPAAPQSVATAAPPQSPVPTGDAKTYRAFVNQYCVGCHNTRNAQPESHPVDLEKASLDDVVADAATWERVLHKLSVRAMPPQGMKRPQETDYLSFTTWLANSLDRAWASL